MMQEEKTKNRKLTSLEGRWVMWQDAQREAKRWPGKSWGSWGWCFRQTGLNNMMGQHDTTPTLSVLFLFFLFLWKCDCCRSTRVHLYPSQEWLKFALGRENRNLMRQAFYHFDGSRIWIPLLGASQYSECLEAVLCSTFCTSCHFHWVFLHKFCG